MLGSANGAGRSKIVGKPVYAISISTPTLRMTKTVMLEMLKRLVLAVTDLSTLLGHNANTLMSKHK